MGFELSPEKMDRIPEVLEQPTMEMTLAEMDRLRKHRRGSLSPNTVRSYRTGITQWKAWAKAQGKPWWPASPEHLALWLSDMGVAGTKGATMRQRLKGVGYLYREQGAVGENPVGHQLVREALAFWGASDTTPVRAAPVRGGDIGALVEDGSARDRAMLMVMRWAMLRPSEAADLCWGDVDLDRGMLCVRRSKTDQEGRGAWFRLPPTCIDALRLLRHRRRGFAKLPEARVFLLSPGSVSRVVRRLGEAAGMPGVTGHSLRRGMALDLVHRGESTPEIMAAGRWKSPDMVARYTEEASASGALARYAAEGEAL